MDMIKMNVFTRICLFCLCAFFQAQAQQAAWTYTDGGLHFEWNITDDHAKLSEKPGGAVTWQGGLLPSFWIKDGKGQFRYLKARVRGTLPPLSGKVTTVPLELGNAGTGTLLLERAPWGIRISRLEISWRGKVPQIVEMYIGATTIPANAVNVKPVWDRPFLPGWQSMGYCVPGAKAGTVQSYFRMWDFGQPDIALGNFGPSMSTPYGAAFPRPVLFAAMGNGHAWISIGAGSVPDGAMTLQIRGSRGCFQYLCREDLWGAPPSQSRTWNDLLRITIDTSAIGAFHKYYASFPVDPDKKVAPVSSVWNTWGMWRLKKYPIRPIADFMENMSNEMMVLDDPWETSQGSGQPNLQKFPDFFADVDYIRRKNTEIGIWETVGWIKDTAAAGLGVHDLIVDTAGKPCLANWNFDPSGDAYYCLDVSSPRTRAFLQERTRKVMRTLKPRLIKLDFGYGMPNPNMGAPRDPKYRGERSSWEMVRLIAEAAKSIDPEVIILYYGISPLWAPLVDMVSLDDQGDLWYDTRQGHAEWSMWASLLSQQNVAISGSSSYEWRTDDEVLMNTIILGSPGAVLPTELENGDPVPDRFLNRRLAVNKWYRRTILWKPAWLNSHTGSMEAPPRLRCWGRLEHFAGKDVLTALTLREDDHKQLADIQWSGNWGLVAQDDRAVTASARLAVIPFSEGKLNIPCARKPSKVTKLNMQGTTSADNWSWSQGRLTITVTAAQLDNTAGFLVESEIVER
ncbi:hypothetical protein CCY01nite_33120 [Chitinophaga cymbidii]|uniref:Alpha-galactosidase n=2 Tax=Chitinophaga cymbidii TaxID=1096750 RepID=A0A512RMZ0_9BACT|nr:hypothetical protein CCY01nite_33120 [Chitinophaga cymbidii]